MSSAGAGTSLAPNLDAARLEAHTLRGLAGYVGGERFRLASIAVEKALREDDLPGARRAHEDLPRELARVRSRPEEFMASQPAPPKAG